MIPVLTAAGYRCIAPDLVGFGRSDKPAAQDDHTYARHVAWMRALLFDSIDLRDVTLVCQDWGSLIGLRLVGEHPDRFARVVVANGGLPTGDQRMSEAFLNWQNFAKTTDHFPVGAIINGGCTTDLSPEVIAAYDAPFADDTLTAGARMFPALVPTSPDDPAAPANRAAWALLELFDRPTLTAYSDQDPITAGTFKVIRERIPGAKGQPHTTIEGGGHFLQEDRGPELAKVVADFIAATPHPPTTNVGS
jgi:haloalkane dehalogenase